jgi:predicted nucleic acid-binding protein
VILDTTVLIDLQRELRKARPGPVSALLEASRETEIFLTFVTCMEFAEGFPDDERVACEKLLSGFRVLWPDTETVWQAARLSRSLRAEGGPIGDHDLWIAALALQHQRTVVSRNNRHFGRVPGLSLRSY